MRALISPQGPTTAERPPLVDRTRTRLFSTARNRATWKCWISADHVFDHESLVMFRRRSAPLLMKPAAEIGKRILEADGRAEGKAIRPPAAALLKMVKRLASTQGSSDSHDAA